MKKEWNHWIPVKFNFKDQISKYTGNLLYISKQRKLCVFKPKTNTDTQGSKLYEIYSLPIYIKSIYIKNLSGNIMIKIFISDKIGFVLSLYLQTFSIIQGFRKYII